MPTKVRSNLSPVQQDIQLKKELEESIKLKESQIKRLQEEVRMDKALLEGAVVREKNRKHAMKLEFTIGSSIGRGTIFK